MAGARKSRGEEEAKVLDKVGEAISAVKKAKHVDQVICALHSLAALLFPLDASLVSGAIDEGYREQVLSAKAPSADERRDWWQAFYRGAAFSTFARFLLIDVASNWLTCFPISAHKHAYDVFFVNGRSAEVVQVLVPCLQHSGSDDLDVKAVHSNTERLLVLCLLEDNGVLQMARELGSCQSEEYTSENLKTSVSRLAQLVASIPDKAQLRASSLSSHLFFKQVAGQLLSLTEERDTNLLDEGACHEGDMSGTLLFVGETFSRMCRRGSVDVLLSELIPRILSHVTSILSSSAQPLVSDVFESNLGSQFWLSIIQAMKDSHAVERMSEQLLHQLATQRVSDVEAYWVLWLLFHRVSKYQISVRSMFSDKFLLWKVFPLCCLRWILQFAVLECPPDCTSLAKGHNTRNFLDILQHLVAVWSKKEFVQSAPVEQQIYVSAAVGLLLEKMSKEELDETKDVMHSILKGVSCRLESPNHLIRRMASNVALVFSKVIDPKNPLYLDDSCTGDAINWEFGLSTPEKGTPETLNCIPQGSDKSETSTTSVLENGLTHKANNGKSKNRKLSEPKLVDPDEIIDPITLNYESFSDEDEEDDASETSDVSSDSSLQPYDLSDDDTDLKRKFSQLVDVVGALRKPDDADGVENALGVAEKLVRASPDELKHVAGDLVRTLVQVRCSDLAVEGEEDSAEDKRQRTLVALLVTCPLESLETLNKLIYSPNVDVSQRIMILDVMTEAAQELAHTKIIKPKQAKALISTTAETQAWFLPSKIGPSGAGPWKEISESKSLLSWTNRYERELPSKPGQIKRGKTRHWSLRSANEQETQLEWSNNKFPVYAASFMLPAMQGFDKKRQGVDLLDRDFIVLGKLIHMLGVCMKCAAMHPEASALAAPLLDMLRSREVCHHKEAYVRKAVLFAASCVLLSLHPSYVATSLIEGNAEISNGLEWVRTWALHVAESDTDRECYTMAMACLQLHAEMALQASRALESAESASTKKGIGLPSSLSKGTIIIPHSNVTY